ncbi:GNAT family N-acetyltransferase [Jonesia quinghaiensis]|uniref:GNAT family N-acetyltransferase n=1 Tax=Jonesia quinghaiensis TaxID=262806 RepID=UPI000416A170|nr:GNAT family N-acetyltransferase [Jonesia quinghaiensis]
MTLPFAVLESPQDLSTFYERVLRPSFPETELVTHDEFLEACTNQFLHVIGVIEDDNIVAGAVGTMPTHEGVMMLLYLALQPGLRGAGIGGKLLDCALARWQQEFSPTMILAEVEHPNYHPSSEDHGDPAARMRFYARHGGRILDIPYFQPAIREGEPPVPALMLVTLWVAPEAFIDDDCIIAWPLRAALRREIVDTCPEGFGPAIRVAESVAGDAVRLWESHDIDRVPVGLFDTEDAVL